MVYITMPVLIRIAHKRNLFTKLEARSSHVEPIPSLGGIGIFFGLVFSFLIVTPIDPTGELPYFVGAFLIIFLTGAKDDLEPLSPKNKTLGLFLAIAILVIPGNVRLDSMYGLLGFSGDFPYWLACLVSIFTIYVITNAFNLIDGINGLAASLGILMAVSFGTLFFLSGQPKLAILCFGLAGALLAFLRYNITPAQIFMGDSGSLILGSIAGVMAVKFISLCSNGSVVSPICFKHPVAIAVSFLIIPLFDTIRVFATRIYRGLSPFQPDRRHIHHLLIDCGYSHTTSTAILLLVNVTIISLVVAFDSLVGLHELVLVQIVIALVLTYFLHRKVRQQASYLQNESV